MVGILIEELVTGEATYPRVVPGHMEGGNLEQAEQTAASQFIRSALIVSLSMYLMTNTVFCPR